MSDHPLITTLKNLRGNPRASVYTEPLWGIPFNLYAPYISVYMLALGVNDAQIGLLASIGLALQVVMALFSGALTDKFGRKRTTLISDILSWSVPCLIWAFSQNFNYFLAATVVNSLWRISMTSWNCLLVEDAEQDQLVYIYGWVYISGLLSAFFAPIAGLLISHFSLIPTLRGLYLFAFGMMTFKFYILNHFATETRQGKVRMEESRHEPFFAVLKGYRGVLGQILHSPKMLYILGVMLVMGIALMVNNNFWAVIVTKKHAFPPEHLAIFSTVKSVVELVLFFVVMPRLTSRRFKRPILLGLGAFILSQILLVTMPERSYLLLSVSVILEACALALASPMLDTLVVIMVNPAERARIMSILSMTVIALTSPFGWIAGRLSEIDRTLPFIMNIGLFALAAWLVTRVARETEKADAEPVASVVRGDMIKPV